MKLRPDEVALGPGDLKRFAELIRKTAGFEIPQARRGDLRRALARRLEDMPSPNPDLLFRKLTDAHDAGEHLEKLLADLTIGETYFFRDRAQMEALESRILPEIIDRNRRTRSIRIWSAACSSGEEPYSLAILLRKVIPDLDRWNVLVLASDINRAALTKAARGVYRSWSFRQTPPELRAEYFTEQGTEWKIGSELREMVTFRYLNLAQDSYPSLLTDTVAIHLILCRNVLMYFTVETARAVVQRLNESLNKEGWLLVGHAEPPSVMSEEFAIADVPGTAAFRKIQHSVAVEDWSTEEFEIRTKPTLPDGVSADETPPSRSEAAANENSAGLSEYLKARASADQMDFREAHRHIDASLKQNPLLAAAHCLRGLIYQEEGNLEEAVKALRRCVYAAPDSPLGYYALASAFGRLGQRRSALKALENVTRLLDGVDKEQPIPEGDGLTVGRLMKLADVQRELISS